MFSENQPCTLTTSKGSEYMITKTAVCRNKKATNEIFDHNNRNIFYTYEINTQTLLQKRADYIPFKVQGYGDPDLVTIIFSDGTHFPLKNKPEIKLRPVDMFLDNNGNCIYKPNNTLHRCHIGHPITDIKYSAE
jgi:hypothetical protein